MSNVTPIKTSKLANAMQQANDQLAAQQAEPIPPQLALERQCREDGLASGEKTHIKLTLPIGSIVHTAGDWIIVQFGPDVETQLAAFNRFNGSMMPVEMLHGLMAPPEAFGDPVPQSEQAIQFLDKAGRPMGEDGPEVKLATPGKAMVDLVTRGVTPVGGE